MKNTFKKFRAFINRHAGLTSLAATAIILLSTFSIATSFQGCQYYTDGTGQEVVKLTDETTEVLDKGAELAPIVQEVVTGLGIAIPGFAALAGGLVAGIGAFFGAYKKYRPQITREHNSAVQAGNLTKALVYAIEQYKIDDPESWDDLKGYVSSQLTDKVGPEALAIIETLLNTYKEAK